MTGHSWLAGILAGVMAAIAIYCVARLVISWTQRRPTDGAAAGASGAAEVAASAASPAGVGAEAEAEVPRAVSPRLAACCQIAMSVTMGYLLVMML